MRGIWWKALSVVILIYVILAGFLVPLKPGIHGVNPERAQAGDTLVMHVDGYNTFFTKAKGTTRAWLKLNENFALPATEIRILSDMTADLHFNIPRKFPAKASVQPMALVFSDSVDGSFVLPNALFVSECTFGADGTEGWQPAQTMQIAHSHAFGYPYRNILYETIRNVYFHIPMWFGMIIIFFGSAWCSIQFVRKGRRDDDLKALALASTGTLFGVLGLLTGSLWSRFTWGSFWSWDVKQNTAAIAVLIYLAYFVLRSGLPDPDRKARVAAVYNIFSCAMLVPLLFVIPRLTDSLHPGSGGNPALGGEDLDNTMRTVFYPAVIGWTLLGVWISELRYRVLRLEWRTVFGK